MSKILYQDSSQIGLLDVLGVFGEKHKLREEIHSDILAFFLKQEPNLLENLLKHFGINDTRLQISQVEVEREAKTRLGYIDILVEIPLKTNSDGSTFAVVIENKITSFEHGDQLRNYYDVISKKYQEDNCCFVFLSPDGRKPTNDKYLDLSYKDLAKILKNTQVKNPVIQTLFSLYINTLNQVAKYRFATLQVYLAAILNRLVQDYSEKVTFISIYRNTWIDFKPKGWDAIDSLWQGNEWGFSFYMTKRTGLSLELYFRESNEFHEFHDRLVPRINNLPNERKERYLTTPNRVGQGAKIWMTIWRLTILSPTEFREKENIYALSKPNSRSETIAEIEPQIQKAWEECIKEYNHIYNMLLQTKS